MKIIIVDDHSGFRESLRLYIEAGLGHKIIAEAGSGAEFLRLSNIKEADIILMDLRMDDMDGFETTFTVLGELSSMKIMAVSNEAERAKLEKLIDAGFKGFLKKTDVFERLEIALQTVISGQYYYPYFTNLEIIQKLEFAQKTARFKKEFLAKMSHEIRIPLTGVLGLVELLEFTQLTDEQIDIVKDLKVSGEFLKNIINQILEYSKIEAGGMRLTLVDFELLPLLENTKALFRNNLTAGVKFNIDVDSQIPLFIKADKLRISQVINNLVSNAIKFTQKGSITIMARWVNFENGNEKMIMIEVCDTGIGMPEKLKKKLFNPFVQSELSDQNGSVGTGLGLSICKELAKLMKGKIGVESKLGTGSTFWFSFMAESGKEILPPQAQTLIPKCTKSLNVLLVEDMILLRKMTKITLNHLGHEVHLASNGQQALDMFEPGKFDLILMDINMPVMDGVTATRKLKEKYDNLPPIVGLSANAIEGDKEKYLSLGFDKYITKPFNKFDFEKLFLA